mmetsp:Transcript_4359/g.6613  ORF Transcript_4359/g.6613 Transcript_4359/m.6613 type:complete len:276 (-) Transcript_4359:347-1174(-)
MSLNEPDPIPTPNPPTKRGKYARGGKYAKLEKVLYTWFINARSENVSVTDIMLTEKARMFGDEMGIRDFQYSKGWLVKFKKRHGMANVCGTVKRENLDGTLSDVSDVEAEAHSLASAYASASDNKENRHQVASQVDVSLLDKSDHEVNNSRKRTSECIVTQPTTSSSCSLNNGTNRRKYKNRTVNDEESCRVRVFRYDRLRCLKDLKFVLQEKIFDIKQEMKDTKNCGEEVEKRARRRKLATKSKLHSVEYEYFELKNDLGYESAVIDDSDDNAD